MDRATIGSAEQAAVESAATTEPAEPRREKPTLSREELGSIFYGSLFVITAVGCFFFIGW